MADQSMLEILVCSAVIVWIGYTAKRVSSMDLNFTAAPGFVRNTWIGHLLPRIQSVLQKYIHGVLQEEVLRVSDPRALQEILVKEHEAVFNHSKAHYAANDVIFGPGLLSSYGTVHKMQRRILNPVFTSLHTKAMASKFESVAHELRGAIIQTMEGSHSKEINLLQWTSAAMLETIGHVGFGYTFGALQTAQSPYLTVIRNFMPAMTRLSRFRPYLPWIRRLVPAAICRGIVEWVPNVDVQHFKALIDIQAEHARNILESRRETMCYEVQDDIISAILQANAGASKNEKLPEDQILGQINTFIFAGHETSSSALARILHLLSEYPLTQDRLRTELANSPLEYDKLPYLDAIIREALRLHGPIPTIERYATRDWVLPLHYPGKDQRMEIPVKKGTKILVSLRDANRCKETWGEDVDEFKPERWLNQLPQSVSEAKLPGIYSSTMTFSAGPRACIGYRFTVLEMKVVLSILIKTFRFAPGNASIQWREIGIASPHVVNTLADGTAVLDRRPSLPLNVSIIS